MNLSIDMSSPADLPSLEKINEVFKSAEEMGLDKPSFDHIHVHILPEKYRRIHYEARYRHKFTRNTMNDLCLLIINLQKNEKGEVHGSFNIWDPTQKKCIVCSKQLPYSTFISLINRAREIGELHRDVRSRWYEFEGWKDILDQVKY